MWTVATHSATTVPSMLDVRLFRHDLEATRAAIARRHESLDAVDEVVRLDQVVRQLNAERDDLRSRVRSISDEVGSLFRDGRKDEATELQAESRELGAQEKDLDARSDEAAAQLRDLLLDVPNIPADDCPDGADENDNVVIRTEGFDPDSYRDHQRVSHWEIGGNGSGSSTSNGP